MRKSLAVAVATLSVAGVGALVPAVANAACAVGDTTCTDTTVTINGGSNLSILVPNGSPVNVATVSTGSLAASGTLGNVTVTDDRGTANEIWTASAVATNFTTGAASANETIAATNVSYSAGTGTALAGQVGAFAPAGVTPIGVTAPVGAWAGVGNNTVTWNPTLSFVLLPSQVAGVYSGTVTQSVS
jgi:hypothetical protein